MIRTIRMMKGITPIENDGTRHKKGLITMYQAYSTNLAKDLYLIQLHTPIMNQLT